MKKAFIAACIFFICTSFVEQKRYWLATFKASSKKTGITSINSIIIQADSKPKATARFYKWFYLNPKYKGYTFDNNCTNCPKRTALRIDEITPDDIVK